MKEFAAPAMEIQKLAAEDVFTTSCSVEALNCDSCYCSAVICDNEGCDRDHSCDCHTFW